jgi:hypothetical protein
MHRCLLQIPHRQKNMLRIWSHLLVNFGRFYSQQTELVSNILQFLLVCLLLHCSLRTTIPHVFKCGAIFNFILIILVISSFVECVNTNVSAMSLEMRLTITLIGRTVTENIKWSSRRNILMGRCTAIFFFFICSFWNWYFHNHTYFVNNM